MSRAGVKPDQLDAALDAVNSAYHLGQTDENLAADISSIYRAVCWLGTLDDRRAAEVGIAAQYPQTTTKLPLTAAKYSPLRDKINTTLALWKREQPPITLSPEEWRQSTAALLRVARNMAALSEQDVVHTAEVVLQMMKAENLLDEVSYKDMRLVATSVISLGQGVDFTEFYMLDMAFGEGFCRTTGADFNHVFAVLGSLSYDRIMQIAMMLPNRTRAVHALVQYVVVEQGGDVEACCRLLNNLHAFGILPVLPTQVIREEVAWIARSPAVPTQAQWDEIAPHVTVLLDAFSQE